MARAKFQKTTCMNVNNAEHAFQHEMCIIKQSETHVTLVKYHPKSHKKAHMSKLLHALHIDMYRFHGMYNY